MIKLNEIKTLLSEDQNELALEALITYAKENNSKYENEFIILKADFKRDRKSWLRGGAGELDRIGFKILELADEMSREDDPENKLFEDQMLKKKLKLAQAMNKGDNNRNLMLLIAILFVFLIFITISFFLPDEGSLQDVGWISSAAVATTNFFPVKELLDISKKSQFLKLLSSNFKSLERKFIEDNLNKFFQNILG